MAKDWRRQGEGARRDWKQREAGKTSTASRGLQRVVFTLLSLVLVGLLIWWLIPRGQRVYFAYLAEDYGPALRNPAKVEVATLAPPLSPGAKTFDRQFATLADRTFDKQFTVADVAHSGNSRLAAQKLVEALTAPLKDKWELSSVEFLVLYVNAHGVAIDGEAYLMWNEDYAAEIARPVDGRAKPSLMKLADLLEQVRGLRTEHKLLILDSGQLPADPRLGLFVNEFPRLVEQQVKATGDRTLWVFTGHAPLEQSHVWAADHRTVFGDFVAKGMSGVSRSRDDQDLLLSDFVRYVHDNVRDTVATRTGHMQSPRFITGDRGLTDLADVPAVPVLKHDYFRSGSLGSAAVERFSEGAADRQRVANVALPSSRHPAPSGSMPVALATMVLAQAPSNEPKSDAKVDGKTEAKPEAKPAEKPASTPAGDGKPADPKSADAKPAEATPADGKPTDGKPVAKPADAAAPDATTPATPPTDAKPAETKPAAGKGKKPPPLDFNEIWDKCVQIENPEANAESWSPVDYAPHLWAQLRRQLAWYEAQYQLESDAEAENAAFLRREILSPLDHVLLSGAADAPPPSFIDVFSELAKARAAFRAGPAYSSTADRSRRSVQNFVAAVRMKNFLTFQAVEQVTHYGFFADPERTRYNVLDKAIGELSAIATELEQQQEKSLDETMWTSDQNLLRRLLEERARLAPLPDLQRRMGDVATVPAEAPRVYPRPKPHSITDDAPALWADLYLKLTQLSARNDSNAPVDGAALVGAVGGADATFADQATLLRRIVQGDAPRADEAEYWKAYRSIGRQIRGYWHDLARRQNTAADATDNVALCNVERRVRLIDGRDAPLVSSRDNAIAMRRLCPRIEPRVEFVLAESKFGLPPRETGSTGQKKIAAAYKWDGEPGARATVRVLYENPSAGAKVVRVVNSTAEVRLMPKGTLPEILLEQADDRAGKTNTETAKLQIVVDVVDGGRSRSYPFDFTVDAFGAEVVGLQAFRVRNEVEEPRPIDSAKDVEGITEIDLSGPSSSGATSVRLFEYRIRPFPNRSDGYRFKLTNVSGAETTRQVVVDVLEVAARPGNKIDAFDPNGELQTQYGRKLDQFHRELDLAANAPTMFPFVKPAKPAAKPEDKAAGAAAADKPKEEKPPEEKPADAAEKKDPTKGPPPVADFRHGLVFRVQDKKNPSLRWYYWIDFIARKPESYVEPLVTYDRQRGQLDIALRPLANATQPPDGFEAAWEGDGVAIDAKLPKTMEVKKKRPDRIELGIRRDWFPPAPEDDQPAARLFIHVDGYPRAFVLPFTPEVNPGVQIPVTRSFRRTKIVDPPSELFAYAKDKPGEVHVNVGVQADGRPSDRLIVSFEDGNNRPRPVSDWRAEHMLLMEKGWDEEGTLTLLSKVGDHIGADAIGFETSLTEAPIAVKAELRSGDAIVESAEAKVVVDEEPPELTMSDPSPLRVANEKGLKATVAPVVFDPAGVMKVEFYVFPASKDRLLDADQKEAHFTWPPVGKTIVPITDKRAIELAVPCDKGIGQWSIWAVAVNQTGRRSLPQRTPNPFEISEKETKPDDMTSVIVAGTVIYGPAGTKQSAVIEGKVFLTPAKGTMGEKQETAIEAKQKVIGPLPTDVALEGSYKFEGVAAGTYELTAEGKTPRTGLALVHEAPVTVTIKKGDKGTKSFTVKMMKKGR